MAVFRGMRAERLDDAGLPIVRISREGPCVRADQLTTWTPPRLRSEPKDLFLQRQLYPRVIRHVSGPGISFSAEFIRCVSAGCVVYADTRTGSLYREHDGVCLGDQNLRMEVA
ncbi:MAG: hypothetical protein KGH75_05860 [Rhodospirillales bacterium]|nr:hypothetical protein [Rhodospirillales bacterium]